VEWTADGLSPARVAREDREAYVVYGDQKAWRATVTGAFRHRVLGRGDFPAVGDWVAVQPKAGAQEARIHHLLPRVSAIKRKCAGETIDVQVIAANVDELLICCGLDRDFNIRRIERYLTMAYNSGVAPGWSGLPRAFLFIG
jgi:ribosome biogenesis GTPase